MNKQRIKKWLNDWIEVAHELHGKEKIHPSNVRITLPGDVFYLLEKKGIIIYEEATNETCGKFYFQSQYGRVVMIPNLTADIQSRTIIDIYG